MADAWTHDERIGARVLVVLPTYNEVDNITGILDRLRDVAPEVDMLVVDDGSPDGTAERVRWIARRMPGLHLLERTSKDGLGAAYRAGFAWGLDNHYDVLVEMDADGSHRPEDLPALIAAIVLGADLAIGSRYIRGGMIPKWSLARRMLSRGGNWYASTMLGIELHDSTAGFRAYRASLLDHMDFAHLRADGYGFQIEGAWRAVRCGAQVVEVPIRFEERAAGESKMSKAIALEALRLVTRWGVGERVAWARTRPSPIPSSGQTGRMRDWRVASAVIENDGQILLVENRRGDGRVDWSMPGGVIETGEDPILGLHREVVEETGLSVSLWGPLLWTTFARSESMGFTMVAETFIAHAIDGSISIADPDGIVTDARWFALDEAIVALDSSWVPTRQPFVGWLQERWSNPRTFDYSVEGDRASGLVVELLSQTL